MHFLKNNYTVTGRFDSNVLPYIKHRYNNIFINYSDLRNFSNFFIFENVINSGKK